MRNLVFDLETASNQRAGEWFSKKEIKAPSNYKDPEKIEKYKEAERLKMMSKAALSWITGRVVSYSFVDPEDIENPIHRFDVDEKRLLSNVAADFNCVDQLWGKNSINFDVPFLVGRLLFHRLPIPSVLKGKTFDIDHFFGWSSQSSQRGSLDAYLFGLGFKTKPMSGSMVPKLFEKYLLDMMQGDMAEAVKFEETLEEYNNFDVISTAKIVNLYEGVK